jgi:hypothetical protein
MKKPIPNKLFEKAIADYAENPDVDTMRVVFDAFWILADNILKLLVNYKNTWMKKAFKNKTNTTRDLVCYAFIKLPKFNCKKGRAFNYFTTCMLGWLRQTYRSSKNYEELKARYKLHLEKKK